MASSKQAVLPLWGERASERTVRVIAVGHFTELCDEFADAVEVKDEAKMSACVRDMREVVSRLDAFQRAQFRKWAKEREGQRR